MKIKTQFFVTMVIFGIIMLVISGSVIVTNREIDRLDKQGRIALDIERASDELSYLSNAYVLYREPQQRARWEAKWSAVFKNLSSLNPGSSDQQTLIDQIKVNHQRLKAVFTDVSSILERPSPGRPDTEAVRAAVEVSWSRMAVQTRGTAFDALRLSQLLRNQQDRLRQTNTRLTLILLSLFTAYFIVNYLIVYRRTLQSISDLQAGTKVVGAGNLDFAIDVKRDDEVGQLSIAFNRMTAGLKDVTASKADLEREIAERKKAEAALTEERERLSVTLGSIGDGVIATDIDGNVVLLNAVAAELTGWTQAEAAGKPVNDVFNIISEVTRKPADDPVRKVLKTGATVGLANHTALVAKDGTERSIADSCAPIRDSEDRLLGVVLVFRDITEQKLADQELRDREERFQSLVNTALDAIICGDESGKVTFWNEAAERIFGYREDEIVGKPISRLMPKGFRQAHEKGLKDFVAGGKSKVMGHTVELTGAKKDGREFPLELSLSTWKQKGRIFFTAIIHETTKRKLAEAALAAERERLAVTLESIGDGVIATDTDGRIVLLNKVAQDLTGWTQKEAAGQALEDIFHIVNKKTRKRSANPLEKTMQTGRAAGLADHTALISRDGTERSIADSCAPIRVGGGEILGAVLVFRDVTEENRAEEERRRAKKLSDALNDINAAITSTLEVDEIIDRAVVEAAQALECEAAVRLGDDSDRDSELPGLSVPLVVKGETLGVLSFNHDSTPAPFTESQIDFATKLTVSVSLALENARLYAAERKVAETLQETMLTLPAAIPGIEFGHIYRSATETAKVGGDFYDLFELEHDRIGIVIGDVAGKGLEAAALTMLIKSTIKAYAYENFFPASIIAKTNDLIGRATIRMSDFVSVFFGVLDKKTGHLTYCSGGHPPAVLQRADGPLEWLTEGSPIVGAFPNISFKDAGIILEPGDRLILYTDGVTEARRQNSFFGEEGLKEILPDNAETSVSEVPLAIYNHISEYTGGALADDVALLAVRWLPPSEIPADKLVNATDVP